MALSVGFRFVSLRTATSYRLDYDCFLEKIMEQRAERNLRALAGICDFH